MKKMFINNVMNNIKKKYPNYDNDKLEVIEYGIDTTYIMITKTIVISLIALVLNVFKEMLILLLLYNIIRTTAFGMHAKKSSHCYIISILFFIGGAIICKYVNINIYVNLFISIISFIFLAIYAPADTYKRPIVNSNRRRIYKILTIISSLIYLILIIYFKDNNISKYLCLGLLEAMIMTHPLTYRMFHLPYNNYKSYTA